MKQEVTGRGAGDEGTEQRGEIGGEDAQPGGAAEERKGTGQGGGGVGRT